MGGLPTEKTIYTIGVNAVEPKVLYAALREGVFQSTDAGKTWTKLSNGLEKASIVALAAHPSDAKVVFAATAEGVIFKSTDGGQIWRRQN